MAVILNKANLVLKDANGNIGKIEQLSSNDLAKIKTAVSDVALVVNQSNHTPIKATANTLGVVKPDGSTITVDRNGTLTATNATKATQDSAGQQINTTYVKGVTASNAIITVTKGNGTTSKATINNVANATNATNANHAKTADSATNAANLGGYPATKYIRSVNSITPDAHGNVQLSNVGAITGEIKWFAFNTVPTGYLVCNGAQVSRTTYADLFKAIGTTFGKGNGSTTFNLPDLRDRYIIGANTNALGTKVAEQLPNIKGRVSATTQSGEGTRGSLLSDGTGAFTTDDTSAYGIGQNTATVNLTRSGYLYFNAHSSTSTYVDEGKVYPLSLALLPCIKY